MKNIYDGTILKFQPVERRTKGGVIMECILIHKPIGALPPEVMKLTLDMAKKLGAKPLNVS